MYNDNERPVANLRLGAVPASLVGVLKKPLTIPEEIERQNQMIDTLQSAISRLEDRLLPVMMEVNRELKSGLGETAQDALTGIQTLIQGNTLRIRAAISKLDEVMDRLQV